MAAKTRTLRTSLGAILLCTAAGILGCATILVPTEQMSNAEIALRKADESGAAQYAPLELHVAREKLDEAGLAFEDERYEQARRLAEQAFVDAEHAEAKARTEKARRNAKEVSRTVEVLRGESRRPLSN
jgi:uncharacterized membrane protein YqiK